MSMNEIDTLVDSIGHLTNDDKLFAMVAKLVELHEEKTTELESNIKTLNAMNDALQENNTELRKMSIPLSEVKPMLTLAVKQLVAEGVLAKGDNT